MSAFDEQLASFRPDIRRLNATMQKHLASDVRLIRDVGLRQLQGGKQLRAIITLLAGRMCGVDDSVSRDMAAATEFIHSATLLHDDVVDEAVLRRRRAAANKLYGNATAVLVGDFLYSRASQIFAATGCAALLRRVACATNQLAEGEVIQLIHKGDPEVDEETYYAIIARKTANLFEIAATAAATLSASPMEKQLAQYGRHLGLAFQLVDDCLDYEGDDKLTGKKIGVDFLEGKMTLPLILAADSPATREQLLQKWRPPTAENFAAVLRLVQQSGALPRVHRRAKREANTAAAAISDFSPGAARDSLLQLARLSVQRQS